MLFIFSLLANAAGQFAVIVTFLALLFAIMGAAGGVRSPPIPMRFSLRTLLIATTLVAVVLGLIVWASR